jgi:CRISPR-associated endonuclease/helicase Cas3
MILAKKLEIDRKIKYQSLQEHTEWVINEALKLTDSESLNKVSNISGFSKEKIVDLIFFSAYFHDIGKATIEFQNTILNGTNSYHSLYSASLLTQIEDFDFLEDERYINLVLVNSLTHHTLLPYHIKNQKFTFLEEAKEFFCNYKSVYESFLNKSCNYNFEYNEEKEIKVEIEAIEDDLKYIKSKEKLRVIYSYVSGILNLADWLASARFSNTKPNVTFLSKLTTNNFIDKLPFRKDDLKDFQKQLSNLDKSVLVEIPTGEGKTEGSLLWAVNNLFDSNTKIIYTLPTQTTSNKLYERIQKLFDKKECGLIHSSAKLYLEKEYERENGKIDNFFRSDFLVSKTFNKPVTISTIDSLLKYFINIGRFNIATKNFLNSLIIIDEVHSYDLKLMGFLKRFLEICQKLEVKVCLMSASIPNKIKELLNIQNYPLVSEEKLFSKKANEIIKKEEFLDEDLENIINTFRKNKKVLVIRNTVSSAIKTYEKLKKFGLLDDNIILYHSTFKKRDRVKKEEIIFEKLNFKKPFILVATQVVEVSLDIDFDVMFSDNAPIDSLIQRFGRVNRKKISDKKGKIFIYKTKNSIPYRDTILNLTFKTIQNGCFELGKYVEWLNIVYNRLFEEDITIKNELTRLFDETYKKYDKTLEELDAIKQSNDNYDLRDINQIKNDYLLYNDYINDRTDYEYTISLPIYLEKKYRHHLPEEIEERLYYKILNIDYSFEKGILLDKEKEFEIW